VTKLAIKRAKVQEQRHYVLEQFNKKKSGGLWAVRSDNRGFCFLRGYTFYPCVQSSFATHPAHQPNVTKSSVPGIKWLEREAAQLSLMPIPLIRNPDALVARKDYHVIITANIHDGRKGGRPEGNRGKGAGRRKSGRTQTTKSGRFFSWSSHFGI
jgi:hypothetical protein